MSPQHALQLHKETDHRQPNEKQPVCFQNYVFKFKSIKNSFASRLTCVEPVRTRYEALKRQTSLIHDLKSTVSKVHKNNYTHVKMQINNQCYAISANVFK
ncbi:hypothetical protein BBOV_III007350 [Babesia bovis T2Bo]|uniref:Uncharacterized protein n=1 Tax=Babesia bovis TaxID=5865 RepID=A7AP12_BABBO|nr:hypothetical protein BBOV_III007350 [Babesia bovis T2Bo]EDO08296.1 hypothetical protein BBOV_III007350 [Babesia bovis T2Bo]|eukprot:XP_001611864.1 hypothetical protein [Babesia bovis T2Bo]